MFLGRITTRLYSSFKNLESIEGIDNFLDGIIDNWEWDPDDKNPRVYLEFDEPTKITGIKLCSRTHSTGNFVTKIDCGIL